MKRIGEGDPIISRSCECMFLPDIAI